jgi:hypothetical protein
MQEWLMCSVKKVLGPFYRHFVLVLEPPSPELLPGRRIAPGPSRYPLALRRVRLSKVSAHAGVQLRHDAVSWQANISSKSQAECLPKVRLCLPSPARLSLRTAPASIRGFCSSAELSDDRLAGLGG